MDNEEIIKALDTYFNREEPPKFINVSRIPLICQDIKAIRESLKNMEKSADKKEDDHEGRIRLLETFQNNLVGKMAIGAFVVAVVVGFGMWALEHYVK